MFGADKKFRNPKAGLLLIGSPMFEKRGIGLERGSYDDRIKKNAEKIMDGLSDSIDIVYSGIVYTKEKMQEVMIEFFKEGVDFVMVEFMSWAEDFSWIRFLRDMPEIPVLFVNPVKEKMPFKSSIEDNDFIDFLTNTSIVGSLEASGSVKRIGRKNVKMIIGSREELNQQILKYAKSAKVRAVLKQATVGLLANFNEIMWVTYMDPYDLFTKIGPELKSLSYISLAEEIEKVTDEEVKNYTEELISKYEVLEDADPQKMPHAVRASIGIAKLAKRYNIDAMIFNDLDESMLNFIGCRPGFYHPMFNENLSILVPEADMGAGLMTFIMKVLSGGKQVNFIEAFYIESETNTFAAGHAGPNDFNDPDFAENVKITRDAFLEDGGYKYAAAPFAWYRMPAGRKTMVHFSEKDGNYKVICTLVDSLEGEHMLLGYSHTMLRPVVPVEKLFGEILSIGADQHYALVEGDYRAELSMLAEMMGFEYYEIV